VEESPLVAKGVRQRLVYTKSRSRSVKRSLFFLALLPMASSGGEVKVEVDKSKAYADALKEELALLDARRDRHLKHRPQVTQRALAADSLAALRVPGGARRARGVSAACSVCTCA